MLSLALAARRGTKRTSETRQFLTRSSCLPTKTHWHTLAPSNYSRVSSSRLKYTSTISAAGADITYPTGISNNSAGSKILRRKFHDDAGLVPSPAQRATIYALATPPGKAAIAIIRVSGPAARTVYSRMVRPARRGLPNLPASASPGSGSDLGQPVLTRVGKHKMMERCGVVDCDSGELLDDGMCVFFEGPKSFTTEDTVELYVHSGRAVLAAVLSSLSRVPGTRPAERGEFTRRAFEAGRIDLTEVEGIRDLVEAETEAQRRLAVHAARGTTRARFEEIRAEIIRCLAMVEALIDFGEGEDIEEGVYQQARDLTLNLREKINGHLSDNRRGELVRSGIRIAIFGPPNAGKSSLLNFLVQREAAIVTPLPGTTRDVLELSLDVGGMPVIVCDTAGLRDTTDVVEKIGVERAAKAVEEADVSLCVLSLEDSAGVTEDVRRMLQPSSLVLLNKTDLVPEAAVVDRVQRLGLPAGTTWWAGSVKKDAGMKEFTNGLTKVLKERFCETEDGTEPLITQERHRVHLQRASEYLDAFLETDAHDVVLGAEELRYAAVEIGMVSGMVGVEDVLDVVFGEFCIGK
ncbi:hypothetical protein BOTBODRAFT_183736 [Botryobasidium botryosum FD-172 SS1]|uniref:TrmE-type G domain-containing protein n=1 Tax=Botryobasidium botryosum (strain FD-172 SS1) TaxID=930990 RepID=A0A067MZ98_BOTB1|nr:hypothetical protein BOTBODRAFT_183736 [Botryobasidium botryosum FD-172 SS1]